LLGSAQWLLFQTLTLAPLALVLPALAIAQMTGLDKNLCVAVIGLVVVVYTLVGGLEAVMLAGAVQGALLLFAPALVIGFIAWKLPGGVREIFTTTQDYDKLQLLPDGGGDLTQATIFLSLYVFLQFSVLQTGNQPMMQRFFAVPRRKLWRTSAVFVLGAFALATVASLFGLAAFAYFHHFPGGFDALNTDETLTPLSVVNALPSGAVGWLAGAIFAAAAAAFANGLNGGSTLLSEDFYRRLRPSASDGERLVVLRLTTLTLGLLAVGMALMLREQGLGRFFVNWSRVGEVMAGSMAGVFLLGLLSRRANAIGAGVGFVAGVATAIYLFAMSSVHPLLNVPIALGTCFAVGYVVSFVSGPPAQKVEDLTVY
jgi:Na+/proline symporter